MAGYTFISSWGSPGCCRHRVGGVVFPPVQEQELRELLHQTPIQWGVARSRWRLRDIRQAVPWLRNYSLSGIWRVLQAFKLHYKRGQQAIYSPDPQYQALRNRAQACVAAAHSAPQQVATLYLDEFSFYRWPTVAPAYAPAGRKQPLARLLPAYNTRGRLIVALEVTTGQLLYRQRAHIDLDQLVGFMFDIRAAFPHAAGIFVIQDNWHNVHFHPRQLAAAAQLGITLVPLPIYAPWLNPVEKVGRKLRQEVIHMHRQADDWPSLKQRVCLFLDQFDRGSPDLLRYVGLLPV